MGTKNLANILKKKIKKFIQIGSSIENGKIKSPQRVNIVKKSSELKSYYGRSKHLATKYLLSLYKKFFSSNNTKAISSLWSLSRYKQINTLCNFKLYKRQ